MDELIKEIKSLKAQVADIQAAAAAKSSSSPEQGVKPMEEDPEAWEQEEWEETEDEKISTWSSVLMADKVCPTSGMGNTLAGLLESPPTTPTKNTHQ